MGHMLKQSSRISVHIIIVSSASSPAERGVHRPLLSPPHRSDSNRCSQVVLSAVSDAASV